MRLPTARTPVFLIDKNNGNVLPISPRRGKTPNAKRKAATAIDAEAASHA